MNRRSFLAFGGVAFAGAARRVLAQRANRQTTVETTLGKMRGYVDEGVHVFKGVRYGAPTGGTARFLPPARPKPWAGIREATAYGSRAPQPFHRTVPEIGDAFVGKGQRSISPDPRPTSSCARHGSRLLTCPAFFGPAEA